MKTALLVFFFIIKNLIFSLPCLPVHPGLYFLGGCSIKMISGSINDELMMTHLRLNTLTVDMY